MNREILLIKKIIVYNKRVTTKRIFKTILRLRKRNPKKSKPIKKVLSLKLVV